MKAIQMTEYGGPEVLRLQEVKIGKPSKNQALVRIHAAGVNFIDIYQRRGIYPVQLPYIPGLEGAGVVEEIGEGVKNVKPGDRVAFIHQPGSYAQEYLLSADHLIPLPSHFSFEEGAAFPLQGMTAHYLLHEFHKIKSGDVVLIQAAAGGMGLLLVQWAKHLGARVLGTVSTNEKAKIAKQAGADEVIIYTEQDFATEVRRLTNDHGADLIIDGVSKTTFPGDLKAVANRGHIVVYGAASGRADPISPNDLTPRAITVSGGTLFEFIARPGELEMRSQAVLQAIQEGWLKLRIDHIFPLEKAAEAHKQLEDRRSIGKIVLKT